ncbi:LCP family protein [Ruminococcus flavefaciens]|uniref:Transcriptional attenuator, LytR family n=1 Tax=Ruminococcus flavefaciens TaxID=1265 RepID=A0A1M7MNU3_RUMFL|nr:LCP family protein [Ruminococcus flavefaciens]SHM92632.1 transcriptional attenuator, LytR family [Ruminococcus flavefaciens]
MAKGKSGHIAVPFLVTIFIGLIIVGGIAYGAYRYFGLGKQEELTEPIPLAVDEITSGDNHTMLMVLDAPEKNCPPTFILMRSMPIKKSIVFIGIPSNTIALVDDKQMSIRGSYESGGPTAAVDFVTKVFGLNVDRYMKLNSDAAKKVYDIFGDVSYPVNADIAGFQNDGSSQLLNSEQALTFVTYTMFKDGESERAFTAASFLTSMFNQTDGKYLADNMDNNFGIIINMVESNVTSADYKKHKTAIKNMFENGKSIASALSLDGTISGQDFIPSENFIEKIKEKFSETK